MVVARQRPATAKGIVFMLLEDEGGVVNVIVPPPVYERCRLAVRTASFALVAGKLERREGVINLLARSVERLAMPDAQAQAPRCARSSRPAERETAATRSRQAGETRSRWRPESAQLRAGADDRQSARTVQHRLQNVCSVRSRS